MVDGRQVAFVVGHHIVHPRARSGRTSHRAPGVSPRGEGRSDRAPHGLPGRQLRVRPGRVARDQRRRRRGPLVESAVPSTSTTDELRRYDLDLLDSPLDVRDVELATVPGAASTPQPSSRRHVGRRPVVAVQRWTHLGCGRSNHRPVRRARRPTRPDARRRPARGRSGGGPRCVARAAAGPRQDGDGRIHRRSPRIVARRGARRRDRDRDPHRWSPRHRPCTHTVQFVGRRERARLAGSGERIDDHRAGSGVVPRRRSPSNTRPRTSPCVRPRAPPPPPSSAHDRAGASLPRGSSPAATACHAVPVDHHSVPPPARRPRWSCRGPPPRSWWVANPTLRGSSPAPP